MTLVVDAELPAKLIHPLTESTCRYVVLYGGRGGAKSWSVARALIIRAMASRVRVLCAREFMSSMHDSVHKLLVDQISLLGFDQYFIVEKGTIVCKLTNAEFRFVGIRNNVTALKSFEAVDICWVEEAQNVTEQSWDILIPTIRKPNSQIFVTFNPDMETDNTYQRFVLNTPPNSCLVKINYTDNEFLYREADGSVLLKEAEHMKLLDPDKFQNIWLGQPLQHLENAVYAQQLRELVDEERICPVPYNPEIPVETFWDIGRSDMTACIFAQYVMGEFHIIDYEERNNLWVGDWLKLLEIEQRKRYKYARHWLPHDASHKLFGARRTVKQIIDTHYPGKTKEVQKLPKNLGIEAAKTIFPNCYFDEVKTRVLIANLRKYRWDTEKRKPEPLHDQYSHAADAFRYMALSIKPEKKGVNLGRPNREQIDGGWMG